MAAAAGFDSIGRKEYNVKKAASAGLPRRIAEKLAGEEKMVREAGKFRKGSVDGIFIL